MAAGSSQSFAGEFSLSDSLDETTALYTTDGSSSSEENTHHYAFARMTTSVGNKHKDSAVAVKRCGALRYLCIPPRSKRSSVFHCLFLYRLLAEKADLLANPVPFV